MIKKIVRWIFFGELETGLETAVVFYSMGIAFVSYFSGFEVWALVLNGRKNPVDMVAIPFEIAIVLFVAVFTVFLGWFKFRTTPASGVGLGSLLLFLCGTFPAELSTAGIAIASSFSILRGFSAGPAHEQELV